MSYDPNSLEAKKGASGEAVVKNFLENWGAIVTRPDEYGEKSLVDFLAVPKAGSSFAARYVEVKVRKAINYAHGQYPCYAFPVVQIAAYKKFAADKNLPVELWIVDPETGKIFAGILRDEFFGIEYKRYIDGREFPFDKVTKFGLMRFYHQKQFIGGYEIKKEDLAHLRAVESAGVSFSNDETLWRNIDYGTGLVVEDLTHEALAALRALSNDFGENKVEYAIGKFCNDHYDEFCSAVRGESIEGLPLSKTDNMIKALREILTAEQTVADKDFVKVDDILTAPNGINIDIVTAANDSRFFVKAARVSSAIGYKNPGITASSPIIKAADLLKVECHRFPTQRLSGGDSYGTKGYYFAAEDVPKVLAQYCELHYKAKQNTRQGKYNLAAQELRKWFQTIVLPKYSSAKKITMLFERTAILLPYGVRTPNGKILAVFATKNGAFLNLSQLEDAGVNLSLLTKRYTFGNYEDKFVHYMDLSEAVSESGNEELNNWWLNEGFTVADKYNKDFSKSRKFVLEYLGFDLPDEWEKLECQFDATLQSLQSKPVYILHKICLSICKLSYNQKTKKLRNKFTKGQVRFALNARSRFLKSSKSSCLIKLQKRLENFKRPTRQSLNCLQSKVTIKFLLTVHSWHLPQDIPINREPLQIIPTSAKP